MLLLLSGCSAGKAVAASEEASTRFHAQIDAGKFEETWKQGAPDLRVATPEGKWLKLLGTVHGRLGKHHWAKTVGWNDNFRNGSHFVLLDQDTQYEHGLAKEQILFRITGGVPELAGFHLRVDGITLN